MQDSKPQNPKTRQVTVSWDAWNKARLMAAAGVLSQKDSDIGSEATAAILDRWASLSPETLDIIERLQAQGQPAEAA